MVNFDIWDSNCIISRKNGELEYTWIDPERSFWGDPVADFVCLGSTNPFKGKSEALESYNSISDNPIKGTREEQIRWAAAMGYLALIMETEKYYRYTPLHFGWWRNVSGSVWFYSQAFNALN
ncbi:MAG: hypothetical protein LUG85_02790 [Clostridiales bacterium]|nr:hypothetical protein [Clostridiales bacterium]